MKTLKFTKTQFNKQYKDNTKIPYLQYQIFKQDMIQVLDQAH